jgi:hypothetical protein
MKPVKSNLRVLIHCMGQLTKDFLQITVRLDFLHINTDTNSLFGVTKVDTLV